MYISLCTYGCTYICTYVGSHNYAHEIIQMYLHRYSYTGLNICIYLCLCSDLYDSPGTKPAADQAKAGENQAVYSVSSVTLCDICI